jgi:hypothetical protein
MTDLEIVPDTAPPTADKPKRRTFNYRRLEALQEALAATQTQLREACDTIDDLNAENAELRQYVANQSVTTRSALDTAEHAVDDAWAARADAASRAAHGMAGIIVGVMAGLTVGLWVGWALKAWQVAR